MSNPIPTTQHLTSTEIPWEQKLIIIAEWMTKSETVIKGQGDTVTIQGQHIASQAALIKEQATTIQSLCNKIGKQPKASSSSSSYSKSKVEVFANSNKYDRSFSKFDEWWAKLKGWLNINHCIIEEGSYKGVVTVLSQLKELKARLFA